MGNRASGEPDEIPALTGPMWSESKVCESLGATTEAMVARRDSGEVLGLVTRDGVTVYPLWQFQRRDGQVEVKPALVPVFRALRVHDGWAVAVLLHTPSPELDGQTPLDWLAHGGDAVTVTDLASVVAKEWRAGSPDPAGEVVSQA